MDSPTVLVVEGNATNREMIRDYLEAGGVTVILASTGRAGSLLARRENPDVIALDVVLPDANGVHLCRQWRRSPELKDIPVLLISGERLNDDDRVAGLRSGALGHLAKPFSEAELLAQVHLLHELSQTHRQLQRRNRELEASNRELEQFAYVVSHDLKQPLRTVSCYCQLLEGRYKEQLDAEANEFIRHAVGGVRKMQQFIDDLLMYSRVGKTNGPLEPVDLGDVIERVVENLDLAISESGAKLQVEPMPVVHGSQVMLTQLFQNLIENALRFRGKATPIVRVTSTGKRDKHQISVADNGIGIASQYFDRIFDVFRRLHTDDEYPGTGIGLAVCKKIVAHHGGRIWVESGQRQGAEFHVELTAATADVIDAPQALPAPKMLEKPRPDDPLAMRAVDGLYYGYPFAGTRKRGNQATDGC